MFFRKTRSELFDCQENLRLEISDWLERMSDKVIRNNNQNDALTARVNGLEERIAELEARVPRDVGVWGYGSIPFANFISRVAKMLDKHDKEPPDAGQNANV